MGFKVNKDSEFQSEINITPLVDVMLVLLIIFMVTAPLMLNGIKLDLPKTREVNPITLQTHQVVVSLTLNEEVFIGKNQVSLDKLIETATNEMKNKNTGVIYLRADGAIKYSKVTKLISLFKSGGITNVALVTEKEDK